MVEKIIVTPEGIRGLGNIVSSNHSVEDYNVYMSTLEEGTEEIEGVETVVYEMNPLGSDVSISLVLSSSRISIGTTATLTATVTENEAPVSGVSVSFKQGDTVLGSSTTNSSGVATYTYNGANVGTYTIRAVYNNVYSNAETLVVDKVNTTTTFTANPTVITVLNDTLLTATVLDENSNPVVNEYVEFYVYFGGRIIALAPSVTNSNGVATYSYHTNRTGEMEVYAVFLNCPNYNRSESNHVPISVESHTYSLEFGEDSYTATGGSCTVSVLLEKDSAPLADAVVTFSSDESTTVTATTGSDGVASATISFNDSTTLLATYNNITATAAITVQTGWFDPCTSSDNLTGYGSYINLRNNNNQNITLEYDSTENAYALYGQNIGGSQSLIPCSYLDGATNFKFEAEVLTKGDSGYYQFGIGLTSTDSKTTSYNYRLRGDSTIQRYNISNGSESESTKVSETTRNKWWKLSMVKDGTTLTTTITDVANDTVKATDIQTITSRNNQRVGLILLAYGTTYKGYFRNIKAEYL